MRPDGFAAHRIAYQVEIGENHCPMPIECQGGFKRARKLFHRLQALDPGDMTDRIDLFA